LRDTCSLPFLKISLKSICKKRRKMRKWLSFNFSHWRTYSLPYNAVNVSTCLIFHFWSPNYLLLNTISDVCTIYNGILHNDDRFVIIQLIIYLLLDYFVLPGWIWMFYFMIFQLLEVQHCLVELRHYHCFLDIWVDCNGISSIWLIIYFHGWIGYLSAENY
jgi:hypothetical protein